MEQRRTEAYKRSFGDSVGAGLGALTGSGKRFYILEYLSSSKYHHAGESQKIILNQVELGRDPQCQIRFDDTLETVSRRHAAIVRDGDGWKLIHLSKVNDTLVNGQPVRDQWRLDNGDEIQLSSNGPRLRFILPQGEKSMIKNINFTERFSLFRQQVMRPYQRMMWLFLVIFILIIGGLVGWNYYSAKQSDERLQAMTERNEESEKRLMEENLKLEEVINDLTMQVKDGQVLGQGANRQLQEAMKRLQDDHSARLSAIEKNSKSREELIVKMTEENQEYIRHLEALRSEIANIKGQPNPAVVGPNYSGNAGAAATPAPGAGGNAGAVGTPGAGGNAGAVGTPGAGGNPGAAGTSTPPPTATPTPEVAAAPRPISYSAYYPYIYYIQLEKVEYIDKAGELKAYIHTQKTSWAGTGFLLNDGRFVTSRKVIERWYYRYSDKDIDKWVEDLHKHVDAANKNSVIAHFSARSAAGGSLSFTSDQFSIDRTDDRYDSKLDLHLAPVSSAKDLVYTNISLGGGLKFNPSLARGLNAGDELTILGFPASLGVNYAAGPTLGKATSSNNGLAMGLISVTSSSSLLEGAGVPVFKPNQSGELEVVGVSTALSNSIVPIRNMQ